MDRTTKHRILGIVVVIGLVVILLPLFQGGKDAPTDVTVVKAPPFPEQSVQMTADTTDVQNAAPAPISNPQSATETKTADSSATPVVAPVDSANKDAQPASAPKVTPVAANIKTDTTPVTPAKTTVVAVKTDLPKSDLPQPPPLSPTDLDKTKVAAMNAQAANDDMPVQKTDQILAPSDEDAIVDTKKINKAVKKASKVAEYKIIEESRLIPKAKKVAHVTKRDVTNVHKTKPVATPYVQQASLNNNGLISLKAAGWVIQMGSFKNKTNALRLVNQLRAGGYRAFIQHTASSFGDSTRVFVGPEYKQASAFALADRLENDMHLRGIVISYKPLTL